MNWDGEIFVDGKKIVARCLIQGCEFSLASHGEYLRMEVGHARNVLTEHRLVNHKDLNRKANVNLVFADATTL